MANFGYTPVLALYSKTSGALCVRRSKALLTNTSIIVLCFLIKFMRDRKDSRNLPFYIRSEILKNRKEML